MSDLGVKFPSQESQDRSIERNFFRDQDKRLTSLHSTPLNSFTLQTFSYKLTNIHQYIPATSDFIIGTVTARLGDTYRLHLNPSSPPAVLPHLSFKNASRKNRPQLEVGALVYAKVVLANKDMECEVSCVGDSGRADGLGELKGGNVITVGLRTCRAYVLILVA